MHFQIQLVVVNVTLVKALLFMTNAIPDAPVEDIRFLCRNCKQEFLSCERAWLHIHDCYINRDFPRKQPVPSRAELIELMCKEWMTGAWRHKTHPLAVDYDDYGMANVLDALIKAGVVKL